MRLDRKLFFGSLKVGVPNAVGHSIEIAAWAFVLQFLARVSEIYLTITVIGHTFFALVAFVNEALQKGVSTIAANLIGAKESEKIPTLLKSASKFLIIVVAILAVPLLIYPEIVFKAFLSSELDVAFRAEVLLLARVACLGMWLFCLFDGLAWVLAGILTAGGDTRFIMMMNAFAAWCFIVLPVYLAVMVIDAPPSSVWIIFAVYALANSVAFYWRYRRGRWKRDLVGEKLELAPDLVS